jgi:E1A-binding protein p400
MASKGPRSKLDHETRARRQKALEAPREPRKPKVHWDHVLGEMVWLAKEFESERKWKLSMAKKIAQRANKGVVDQATKDERKQKEGEHRLRKVALNISKDVKKFWTKIEKLVLYKNQLEVEERKKKALDKQLDFLLGQTERYSTMLAENLVDVPHPQKQENGLLETNLPSQEEVAEPLQTDQPSLEEVPEPLQTNQPSQEEVPEENINALIPDDLDKMDTDDDYNSSLDEDPVDDERTIDEDEAEITEVERNEELAALQAEADLPLDDILKLYTKTEVSRESSPNSKYTFGNSDLKNLIKGGIFRYLYRIRKLKYCCC